MNLSVLTIRRPVLSMVLSTIIVLLGVVGFLFLGVRQFPDVDPPNITVTTSYPGANADVVESQITEPLEESINGIDGIRSLTSQSSDGRSQITVEFELGEDLEAAANDVRDRVERAKRQLPPDVDPPVVAKADANGQAIVVMTVQSDVRNLTQLTDFAVNVLKERLQTIKGVGSVQVWGERKYAMRLVLSPDRLAAYGLTPSDVRTTLARENVELPAGRLEGAATELSLRTIGRLSTPEEFADLILRSDGGEVVRLRDVARVYLGAENERTLLKRDGIPMVGLAISPQTGANQVEIADEFYRRYENIKANAPKDLILDLAFDNTKFIRNAILEVEETLLIAFALVVAIIFLFLRSWRATIIPVVAIPVSLISGFFFMWVSGFSINVLTLLGIVLATGLVVDDAIVVMENIFRRIEDGESPREAGERGSTEITFAIVSTTITLAVVFLPIIFLPGLTGRLFREFGLVVSATVLVSAFVSLTLTPMMSSRLLRHQDGTSWIVRVTEPFFVWLNRIYESSLRSLMRRPALALFIMAGALAVLVTLFGVLKSELAPLEDRSLLTMNVTAPEGTTFDRMSVIMDTLQARISHAVPENQLVLTVTSPTFFGGGSNNGFSRIMLTDPTERTRSQMAIADVVTGVGRSVTDARTIVIQEQTVSTGGRAGLPVQYVLQTGELEELREKLPAFLAAASADPTFSVVDVNLKFTKPEVTISIDRARARELGVSVFDIGDAIQAGFAGQRYGYFIREGKQYQVIGEIERQDRATPDRLRDLNVRSADGRMIPLSNLVTLTEQSTPPQLYRYNRNVAATVSAGLAPGKTIGDGIAAMDAVRDKTLGGTVSTALTGPSRDFAESSSSLLYAFLLALILVYLILAAQFESFVDPFTIMLTVPLALSGGVLSLWLTGETLNIFSEIGAIVLIGLVTKNGILIVEFANQQHEIGKSWTDAVLESASTRFRPILMTSLATILGALPIALSLGAASGSRTGMGVVIVGGMSIATLLTLYVIPALYVLLSRLKRHRVAPTTTTTTTTTATTAALVLSLISITGTSSVSAQTDRLSLDEAVRIALERNYDIRVAKLDSTSARLIGEGAIGGFLPSVDVLGGITRGSNDVTQVTASGVNIQRDGAGFTNMNAAAQLSWTIFDGLSMFARGDRARHLESAGIEQARSTVALTIADVIGAYGAVVAVRRQRTVLDTALAIAERRLDIVRRSRDAGALAGVDVAQAEVDRNTVQTEVLRVRADDISLTASLNRMLGREPLVPLTIDTALVVADVASVDSLLARARERNPDVLAAEQRREAASDFVRTVTATFLPRLVALGQYQITNNSTDAGFILENRSNGWSAGLQFSMNLFNGFTDDLARQQAEVDVERARLDVERTRLTTSERLVRAEAAYRRGKEALSLEQQSYASALTNARIALEKLRLGTIRDIEVRQTAQTLLEIGLRMVRAEYETLLAATEARRLAGDLVR